MKLKKLKSTIVFTIIFFMLFNNLIPMPRSLQNITNSISENISYASGTYPSNEEEFFDMVEKAEFSTSIEVGGETFKPNYQTYQEKGLIVYGTPSDVTVANQEKINGEWRYLGFTESGFPYTNVDFPPGTDHVSNPHNWNYWEVDPERSSWDNVIPYQEAHILKIYTTLVCSNVQYMYKTR